MKVIRFGMVKLLDFKQRIDELDASDNSFAVLFWLTSKPSLRRCYGFPNLGICKSGYIYRTTTGQ
jgi:hypothetical protein